MKDIEVNEYRQITDLYPWSKFKGAKSCSMFNTVLQLVLLGTIGAFLFGINMSLLNTSLPMINSEYLNCGRDDIALRDKYGRFSPADCLKDATCVAMCGRFEDAKDPNILSAVRCPGGYNDLDCKKLKWLNASISTSMLIGAFIGCMTAGKFLKIGRRACMMVCLCIFAFAIVTCVVANSFAALMWGRLAVGLGVGAISVICPAYLSEMTPPDLRGRYGSCFQLGIVIGIFIGNVLGLPLEAPLEHDDFWSPPTFQRFWWRFMLGIGILPVLLGLYFFGFTYTFETPMWYAEQGRYQDAAECLRLIHGREDVSKEMADLIDVMKESEKSEKMSLKMACRDPQLRWVIIFGCLLAAFQQFGGINVFMTSSNDLFKKAGLSATMQTVMSIIMSGINALMTFPTLYLVERMGRRSLLLVGATGQLIAVLPAAILYWTEDNVDYPTDKTKWLAIIGVILTVACFAIAYGPILWVYLHEIYPPEIKAAASAAATACNWAAGIVMVFVVIPINNQVAYTLFAGLQLIAVIIIFLGMRETRGLPIGVSPFIKRN